MPSTNLPRSIPNDDKDADSVQLSLRINAEIEKFEAMLEHTLKPFDDGDHDPSLCDDIDGICGYVEGLETIAFYYPAWAHGGDNDWLSNDEEPEIENLERIIGHIARFLTECHRKKILHYGRPKQTKLKCGRNFDCTLYCRSAEDRFYLVFCHPSIDEVIEDVLKCAGIALVAAGGAVVLLGAAGWAVFIEAWKLCIVKEVGDWAASISVQLKQEKWHGSWGKC